MRLPWNGDSRLTVHRTNFYALISIPRSGCQKTNVPVMDVHISQNNTGPLPSATRSVRVRNTHELARNSIGEPLVVMLDGWMTAFKRVSVPHRQLGANLIDTHKTLPSSACRNCGHDSLSLSMKTAGFCKRHAFFQWSSSTGESLHFFCVYLFPREHFFPRAKQSFYFNELAVFKHAWTASSVERRVAGAEWEL